MSKVSAVPVWLFLLAHTVLVHPVKASTVLISYSGSYSLVTTNPVTEGIVSLRLALGPLFTDCDSPGQCTQLTRLEGLGDAVSGTAFLLDNQAALQAALSNGQLDLISLAMNFGNTYSPEHSGGGIGILDSPLEASYPANPIDSITFTIDRLLFQTVSMPFGFGTQATLEYTLAVNGIGGDTAARPQPLLVLVPTAPLLPDPPAPTPEPATWLIAAGGLTAVLWRRRVSPRG